MNSVNQHEGTNQGKIHATPAPNDSKSNTDGDCPDKIKKNPISKLDRWLQPFVGGNRKEPRYPSLVKIAKVLLVGIIGILVGQFLPHEFLRFRQQDLAQEKDALFKANVLTEMKDNIRKCQLHVWACQHKWQGRPRPNQDAYTRYRLFADSIDTNLTLVYLMPHFLDIVEIYRDFHEANKLIDNTYTGHPLTDRQRQNLEIRLTATVNKAIHMVEIVSDSIGDESYKSESFLQKDWNIDGNLEKICRDFLNSPVMQYSGATAPEVEIR